MFRWLKETASLDRKMTLAMVGMVLPSAISCGVVVWEFARVTSAAHQETASNYLQILRLGMDASLAASALALVLSIAMAVAIRRLIVPPLALAVASLDAVAGGDLSVEAPFSGRRDEAGRIAAATATLRQTALARLEAEAGMAARDRIIAEERRQVMSALADGLGALAATNRGLRGVAGRATASPPRLVVDNAELPAESRPSAPTAAPVFIDVIPTPAAPPAASEEDPGLVDLLLRLDRRRTPETGGTVIPMPAWPQRTPLRQGA